MAPAAPEETSAVESLGSNGSATPPPVAVESVNGFQDARWVGGTWDLKQFEKDGNTNWDAVIDAGPLLSLSLSPKTLGLS